MKIIVAVLLLMIVASAIASSSSKRSDWWKNFEPESLTAWGEWGEWEYCKEGTYAYAYQQKSEGYSYWGDNSANNAIKLHCRKPSDKWASDSVTSAQQKWGNWQSTVQCSFPDFLHGAYLRSESKQGSGDDASVTNLDMQCKTPLSSRKQRIFGVGNTWGRFTSLKSCEWNFAYICGIQTRIERNQGSGDDSALNGVRFACCRFR